MGQLILFGGVLDLSKLARTSNNASPGIHTRVSSWSFAIVKVSTRLLRHVRVSCPSSHSRSRRLQLRNNNTIRIQVAYQTRAKHRTPSQPFGGEDESQFGFIVWLRFTHLPRFAGRRLWNRCRALSHTDTNTHSSSHLHDQPPTKFRADFFKYLQHFNNTCAGFGLPHHTLTPCRDM